MSLNDARETMNTRMDALAEASGVSGWERSDETTGNCSTGEGQQAFALLRLRADPPLPDSQAEAAATAIVEALEADGFAVKAAPLTLGDISGWEVAAGGPGGEQYILTLGANGGGLEGRSACVPEE